MLSATLDNCVCDLGTVWSRVIAKLHTQLFMWSIPELTYNEQMVTYDSMTTIETTLSVPQIHFQPQYMSKLGPETMLGQIDINAKMRSAHIEGHSGLLDHL